MYIVPHILSSVLFDFPLTTGLILISSSAVIYINNNGCINKIAMNVAWNGMRVLSQLQIWYNGMLSNCCGLWTNHNKMDKCIYIIREGKSIESEIIADDVTMKFNKNYDLVIFRYPSLDDSETFLYKRYNEIPSNLSEDKPIKSLFIVVNIRYGGKVYTVENTDSLMIPNTTIFDRTYTQWYMQYFHNLEIFDDDYEIELLDNEMNEISFNHTKYIKLRDDIYSVGNDAHFNTLIWRGILTQKDIPDNLITNHEVNISDISSPPLIGRTITESNKVITPLSIRSNNTDASFDIVDESEAN
jgi:hypothetical protein